MWDIEKVDELMKKARNQHVLLWAKDHSDQWKKHKRDYYWRHRDHIRAQQKDYRMRLKIEYD